ncbi:MAG: acVLRF1 family peptidyl-tRNA hydrolase [Propionibacteriales bacterium]|nr:acVLRF1 family peptidyl-tRNA hydrolase [Propionibacteriales bacterium]
MTTVAVTPERLQRWVDNFSQRHGATVLDVAGGGLLGTAADGSTFRARLPFSRVYSGPVEVDQFLLAGAPPADWGVLLVRKGGFAIARLADVAITDSKVGQRHVQGRTKAGGQSQQRFARRRGNQARAAYEAAAEHAVRLIADAPVAVVGGDASAVAAVLEDPRLTSLRAAVVGAFLTVPDPRRAVLEAACAEARTFSIDVVNT